MPPPPLALALLLANCDNVALCFLLEDLAKYLEAVSQKKGDLAVSTCKVLLNI